MHKQKKLDESVPWCPRSMAAWLGSSLARFDLLFSFDSFVRFTSIFDFRSKKYFFPPREKVTMNLLISRIFKLRFRVTERLRKKPNLGKKVAQKVAETKKAKNIYTEAQSESHKHLHQTKPLLKP
jgi:hypothetical protein